MHFYTAQCTIEAPQWRASRVEPGRCGSELSVCLCPFFAVLSFRLSCRSHRPRRVRKMSKASGIKADGSRRRWSRNGVTRVQGSSASSVLYDLLVQTSFGLASTSDLHGVHGGKVPPSRQTSVQIRVLNEMGWRAWRRGTFMNTATRDPLYGVGIGLLAALASTAARNEERGQVPPHHFVDASRAARVKRI